MEKIIAGSQNTIELGYQIGKKLNSGSVVLLEGDLGAGKTTFTKGIGKALNVSRVINSPTFTIMKIYKGDKMLYHLDLYRLDGKGDLDLLEYINSSGICVIEWPNCAPHLLPKEFLKITINNVSDDVRKFSFEFVGEQYSFIKEIIK